MNWDIKNIEDFAHEKGYNAGHAEGEAKGKAEGKVEGRSEAQAEMVKNLKALGVDIETIVNALPFRRL